MTDKALINEIFVSIQGEGPYIGYKQLFIRFCGCNLNCDYCDTDTSKGVMYSAEEIMEIINNHQECHSISLTGGEPLLHTGFLKELLPQCSLPVYLETNATLAGELGEVIDYIDYISADLKLPSCSGGNNIFKEHDRFLTVASHKPLFVKVVFDENIAEDEITSACALAAKHRIEIILQPKMKNNKLGIDATFIENTLDKFLSKYKKVRLIPQVHKFLDLK